MNKIYPRKGDTQTVYLNAVVKDPSIEVGDYTIYNDFISNPRQFEQNNVLYHYPINHERLIIGKFCSIACGVKFLFNCANHTLKSLSTYTLTLSGSSAKELINWQKREGFTFPLIAIVNNLNGPDLLEVMKGGGDTGQRYCWRTPCSHAGNARNPARNRLSHPLWLYPCRLRE